MIVYFEPKFIHFSNRQTKIKEINDGLGSRTGKLKSLDKFDSSFFSMLTYLSHSMDPVSRIVLETTYEAFHDAGVCPHQIRGSNTGVYFGINTIGMLK